MGENYCAVSEGVLWVSEDEKTPIVTIYKTNEAAEVKKMENDL